MYKHNPIRSAAVTAWAALAAVFLLPLWLVSPGDRAVEKPQATLPIHRPIQTGGARDRGKAVRLLHPDGSVEETNMADYLWRVVAAEMPASFEPEALKAQACAARTYTARLQMAGGKHESADICTDSACCQACRSVEELTARWGDQARVYTEKIRRSVTQTDGLGVLYGGEPIQALFFSSAPGRTTDAVAVWGNSVDYLKSVDSPEGEEVPNYRTTVTMTAGEVGEKLLAAYPGADLSGSPAGWLTDLRREESGAVSSLLVGGVTLTGNQLRGALGLRSPAFTVDVEGESFTFSVTGYGHGVGMSQYGANEMAREGADFRAILTWYYSGVEIGQLW